MSMIPRRFSSTFGFGSVNRVTLVGNVGKQPELRSFQSKPKSTDSGNATESAARHWAVFSMATSENVKTGQSPGKFQLYQAISAFNDICFVL